VQERLVSGSPGDASIQLRSLARSDLDTASALLAASGLPIDDLANPAISLIGAFLGRELVSVIGLEPCEEVGLLRSLAVAPAHRGRGIARVLCDQLLAIARERGFPTLFLLTTTAADYFAQLGFVAIERGAAPASIRSTAQFASLCPASARVMRLSLG
jgi:amino-acid N-acetyltransferase